MRKIAIMAGTVTLLSVGVCLGDNDTPRSFASVASKHPLSSPTTSELSPSALGIDSRPRNYEPSDATQDLTVPSQIKLGNNTLHFDADKKHSAPPPGVEVNEHSVLNKAPAEPAFKPSYLGLRLTTPMNLFGR